MAASIYVFMTAFAAFDVPAIIGWGNRIFTFSTYLYLLLNPQDVLPRYGLAAALSTVALAIAALASWWYGAMQQRSRQLRGRHRAAPTGPSSRRSAAARSVPGASSAPICCSARSCRSCCSPTPPGCRSSSCRARMAFSTMSLIALRHAAMGAGVPGGQQHGCSSPILVPTVTLAISLAFSWIVLRSRIPGRAGFDFIAFLPHAVPSIIFGVGALLLTLFVLQRALPLYGTIWILLIVFVIARISYGTRMTNSGLIQIHAELEESALVSGASTWDAFRRVTVPLLAPTLLYAWLWIALLDLP